MVKGELTIIIRNNYPLKSYFLDSLCYLKFYVAVIGECMKNIKLGSSDLSLPEIAIGCMRIAELSEKEANHFLNTALELNANFYDHADIYGGGESEILFSKALNISSNNRDKVIIQTKCGIRKGMYDSSKEHILDSVFLSLKRLNTDYLDILLLHRPDALADMEDIADAFNLLKDTGKVKYFGVSNYNPYQIELLKKSCSQPILVNQLQLSITNATMISQGINVNMENDSAIDRDGGILDYCRLKDITIQAWSPLQYGFFKGVFIDCDKYPLLNAELAKLAEKYSVNKSAIALAWILRHPGKIQPITGTTKSVRLKEMLKASDIKLERSEWYSLYTAAGNKLP